MLTELDEQPLRVLLIDDKDDHLLTRDLLTDSPFRGVEVTWVSDAAAAVDVMARNEDDICLLDVRLAREVLDQAEKRGREQPVILLISQDDQSVDISAGVTDFLVKEQTDVSQLERAIRYSMEHGRLLRELREARDQLTHLTRHDSITGLANRVQFLERLGDAIKRACRSSKPVALMVLDLDGLKAVNEEQGHNAGDRILRQVAHRLRQGVRSVDLVACLGDDEFTVILEGMAKSSDSTVVAQRLLDALDRPFETDGGKARVGTIIGIAVHPEDAGTVEELIRAARAALNRAKETGSDRYEFHSREMSVKVAERRALAENLSAALDQDKFVLHYQPQIDLRTGAVTGVEALLRWERDGTSVPPYQSSPFSALPINPFLPKN